MYVYVYVYFIKLLHAFLCLHFDVLTDHVDSKEKFSLTRPLC